MSVPFDPQAEIILVSAAVTGPNGMRLMRLAIDTGAPVTLINSGILNSLGYDLTEFSETIEIMTVSGVATFPLITTDKVVAIGQEYEKFQVIAGDLDPDVEFDGLLGLDFLRNHRLTIDFNRGTIELN